MSPINDLVSLLKLSVEVYHNARVCGNWLLSQEETGKTCFHMPSQGECILTVPDEGEWHLAEGDVVIFPRELAHSMTPVEPMFGPQQRLAIPTSQCIAGTSLLCGSIHFQHSGASYLLDALPKVVIVSKAKAEEWLAPLTTLIVRESINNASLNNPVLNRLCEVLIAYTLRCYSETFSHDKGVFSAYTHPKLTMAITAIHQKPGANWQLSTLAKEAAMSRTQFSQLFSHTTGMTAIEYLTWWRMQVAYAELLAGHSVDRVAQQVGYQSDAAFSRVFKKTFGETVGAVRSAKNR